MRRRRGFTLVELMLIGLLAVLVSAGAFAMGYRAWRSHEDLLLQNEVQREARAAVEATADVLRSVPWTYSVRAVCGAPNSNTYIGYYAGGMTDFSMAVGGTTLRLADENRVVVASVSNVTRFKVAFVTRTPTPSGAMRETVVTDFDNDPALSRKDLRLPYVVSASITVTTSRTSSDGVVHRATHTGTAKIRNNFYTIAP